MAKHDDVNTIEEFDKSVDNFFAEDDEFSEEENLVVEEQDSISTEVVDNKININESNIFDSENPLLQLNAIVLEMDWEISDETLGKYLSEINNLMVRYQSDRPIYLFFKLHTAIGEYVLKKKVRSHPDALKFMSGVYSSLKNALSEGIPLVEKNKLILDEVNNFKILKKKMFPGFYPEEK